MVTTSEFSGAAVGSAIGRIDGKNVDRLVDDRRRRRGLFRGASIKSQGTNGKPTQKQGDYMTLHGDLLRGFRPASTAA
jgi:hypothetical protein